MKKSLKFGLGGLALAAGIFALTSCTSSFCSITDKAHILYLFDYGVTSYSLDNTAESEALTVTIDGVVYSTNLYTTASFDETNDESNAKYINKINDAAEDAYIRAPSLSYFKAFDQVVLNHALEIAEFNQDELIGFNSTDAAINIKTASNEIDFTDGALLCPAEKYDDYSNNKGLLDKYGYIKFDDLINEDKALWTDWDLYNQEVRNSGISIDEAASSDYISFYKKKMNSYISSYRSCLAVNTGDYGAYGVHSLPAQIEGKAWTDWYGLLEFLFVWPIGALVDFLAVSFSAIGSGWAEILAILVVTFIVRTLMLFVTFKQQKSTTVMTELQPEIAKIQSKYPNANTNKMEKQRLSEETARLYKKHKINPLTSILVMLVQFPVFICVWGAMQGAACLSSGEFLGLRLSDSIGSTILQASSWTAAGGFGGLTATILFILMAAAQTVAMLLPRWLQKRKAKKVAKLGRNPAKASQDNKMKWFTYIMLGFIVLMGLSLASGMGVYWFFGALFSVVQSFVTQKIVNKKDKKRRR
ncbi:MAG: membrane protein insertase YidC [Bacilli bacterium]